MSSQGESRLSQSPHVLAWSNGSKWVSGFGNTRPSYLSWKPLVNKKLTTFCLHSCFRKREYFLKLWGIAILDILYQKWEESKIKPENKFLSATEMLQFYQSNSLYREWDRQTTEFIAQSISVPHQAWGRGHSGDLTIFVKRSFCVFIHELSLLGNTGQCW